MASKKPVKEIRMGCVKALVWENDTKVGTRHNVTCARIYKDDADQWQESTSFGRDDLPQLKQVIDEAWQWIFSSAKAEAKAEAA